MAIYYFYGSVYQFAPEKDGWWDRKDGIAARIARPMLLPTNTDLRPIKKVIRLILKYRERGEEYFGKKQHGRSTTTT
jgi:hypothetical protein